MKKKVNLENVCYQYALLMEIFETVHMSINRKVLNKRIYLAEDKKEINRAPCLCVSRKGQEKLSVDMKILFEVSINLEQNDNFQDGTLLKRFEPRLSTVQWYKLRMTF